MNKILWIFLFFFFSFSHAQDRVKWDFAYNSQLKQIEFKATISDGWHLYSQHIKNTIGPVPTSFTFENNANIVLNGVVVEPSPIHEYDENFEAELDFFKNEVVFKQAISKATAGETVKGYITFMVCNEVMCLPPSDYPFSIQIP